VAIDSKVWGRGKAESQWGGGQVLTGPNSGGKFSKLTSKNKNKTKQNKKTILKGSYVPVY
jgi:hypothetical protein